MSKGYVYILKNPSMPGLLKIGKTTRSVEQRCNELWQTGVPTPFEVVEEAYSPNCTELEAMMHDEFAESRISPSREFFAVDKDVAGSALRSNLREQVCALVDEFMPDHTVADPGMIVSDSDITFMAFRLGAHPYEIVSAMEMLTDEEIQPALDRWRQKVEERKAARARGEVLPAFQAQDEAPLQ